MLPNNGNCKARQNQINSRRLLANELDDYSLDDLHEMIMRNGFYILPKPVIG